MENLTTVQTKNQKQNVQIIMLVTIKIYVKLGCKMIGSSIDKNESILGNLTCIAVLRELVIFPNTIFWAHEMNYETFL